MQQFDVFLAQVKLLRGRYGRVYEESADQKAESLEP